MICRVPLCLTLATATLMGPWLCCCVGVTWSRPVTNPRAFEKSAAESPPEVCPLCCQTATPPSVPAEAAKAPVPSKPAAPCPCQRDKPNATVASAPASVDPPADSLSLDRVGDPATLSAVAAGPFAFRGKSPPVDVAHFLIDHCHRLRC